MRLTVNLHAGQLELEHLRGLRLSLLRAQLEQDVIKSGLVASTAQCVTVNVNVAAGDSISLSSIWPYVVEQDPGQL